MALRRLAVLLRKASKPVDRGALGKKITGLVKKYKEMSGPLAALGIEMEQLRTEWMLRVVGARLAAYPVVMARVNYSGEKRRKELEKQRKKEEKKQRKLNNSSASTDESSTESDGQGSATEADAPASESGS